MSVSPPRETIVFNPVYPPRYDPKNLTYFGGLPTLSKKLTWPRGAKTGRPITFIGQVDLSTLPRVPEGSALPSAGVLHFFGNDRDFGDDLTWGEAAVLFSDDESERLEETPPPEGLGDLYAGYPREKSLGWAMSDVGRRGTHAKWWMEPVVCLTYSVDDVDANTESFTRTFPLPASSEVLAPFPEKKIGAPVDLWIPDATFPYLWIFIEAWCRHLLDDRVARGALYTTSWTEPDPEMAAECREWIARAEPRRFTTTTPGAVDELWHWVRSLDARHTKARPEAEIAWYNLLIAQGRATQAERARLQELFARPALRLSALQMVPQRAEKIASDLGARRWFLRWPGLRTLARSEKALSSADAEFLRWLENGMSRRGGPGLLNDVTRNTLSVVTNLVLARGGEAALALPRAAIESNRKLHWPTAESRHQMFGYRRDGYGHDADLHGLLMQFSSTGGMCWSWGDLGEFYFWTTDDDLAQRRFDRVEAVIESS